MEGNCVYRDKQGHCKIGVAEEKEICNIVKAEPNCPDYEEGVKKNLTNPQPRTR